MKSELLGGTTAHSCPGLRPGTGDRVGAAFGGASGAEAEARAEAEAGIDGGGAACCVWLVPEAAGEAGGSG